MKKLNPIHRFVQVMLIFTMACGENPIKSPKFSNAPLSGAADINKSTTGSSPDSPLVLQTYARQLAGTLAGRPLNRDERQLLATEGKGALPKLLDGWLSDVFFAQAFRTRIEMLLGTSGSRDGVDFNLPGNLAFYIAQQGLPFASLLTADYCVDAQQNKIKCDTEAPFAAGVTTTRGFLVAHNSRFNLGRAISMMNVFSCSTYPMSSSLQPRIEKELLIENFRISTEEEAEAKGSTGFGNGSACYSCHGQFAAHTQLFVKFDDKGLYRADATGAQDPNLEFGRGENGMYASHFEQANRASSENSDLFGTDVENLASATKVLSEHPAFIQCMSKHIIGHALGLDSEGSSKIPAAALEELTKSVSIAQPKVADLYRAVLSHPLVLQAFARGVAEP